MLVDSGDDDGCVTFEGDIGMLEREAMLVDGGEDEVSVLLSGVWSFFADGTYHLA